MLLVCIIHSAKPSNLRNNVQAIPSICIPASRRPNLHSSRVDAPQKVTSRKLNMIAQAKGAWPNWGRQILLQLVPPPDKYSPK
jgi:hypothetical protein